MKKSILAILLAFSLLISFAACRKIDTGSIEFESKAYIVDDEGVTREIYNEGSDYFYYDADGNKVSADSKDVVVETNTVRNTQAVSLTPEAQSLYEQIEDAESIEDMLEVDATQPQLENEELIPEDSFDEIDVEVDSAGKPVHKEDMLSYEEILKSETFTLDVNMKVVTGEETVVLPMKTMRDGKNLYVETAFPREDGIGSTRLNFLLLDGTCYVIIPSMRAYMSIPKETVGEMFPADVFDSIEEETESVYVSSGEVVFNGETYVCDVYENEGAVSKFYYKDNQLKRIETVSGDNTSIMEVNTLSTKADKSKFVAPKNYIDITTMMGGSFDPNSVL